MKIFPTLGIFLSAVLWVSQVPAQAPAKTLPDFTELYEKQGAVVVSLRVTQRLRSNSGTPGLSEDDPFFDFFRRFGPTPRGREREREFELPSAGSGFVISNDGYIITNHHVVENAEEVNVRLPDRREFKAKVIGSDRRTDVALIKIEANGLPKANIGDPSKLKVGEWVVAIGQPFGFENTMTAGIVSAKGRDNISEQNLVPFIQTDVAINPGNSGGPLFNLKGEVVGVNSLIYSRTGGYQGLAFSIPIDVVMDVVKQLQTSGKVTRGRIGVVIQQITKELAESFGLSKPNGALVNSVVKDGPAEKAGIEVSDIILKFDGKPINESNELPRIVTQYRPGSKVVVQVWRKGVAKDLTVVVDELKEEQPAARPQRRGDKEKAKPNRLGLVVSELTDEQKKQLGVKHGVLIEDIRGAGRANIQVGDVILAIVRRGETVDVKSAEQLNNLLSKMDKKATVTLLLRRGEQQFYATVPLSDGEEK